MRRPGGDVQALPGVQGDDVEQLLHAAVQAFRVEGRGVGVPTETGHRARILAGAQHVPDLLLAEEVVTLRSRLVVRVYAQRHPPADRELPDTHRELSPVEIVDVVPDHAVEVGVHHFGDAVAGQPALAHQRVAVPQVRQPEGLAAPGVVVLQGAETQGI